jgi:hypothetical protein
MPRDEGHPVCCYLMDGMDWISSLRRSLFRIKRRFWAFTTHRPSSVIISTSLDAPWMDSFRLQNPDITTN